MRTFIYIIIGILFWTICFVPTDDAPLSTYFLWAVYCVSILWVFKVVAKALDEWKEDEQN